MNFDHDISDGLGAQKQDFGGGQIPGMSGIPDVINGERDDREDEGAHDEDFGVDDKSQDSELQEAKAKLGPLDDEDEENDKVGDMLEITHDGKVQKEILEVGTGGRLKMGYEAQITYKAYFYRDHVIFDEAEKPVTLGIGIDNSWPDGL